MKKILRLLERMATFVALVLLGLLATPVLLVLGVIGLRRAPGDWDELGVDDDINEE